MSGVYLNRLQTVWSMMTRIRDLNRRRSGNRSNIGYWPLRRLTRISRILSRSHVIDAHNPVFNQANSPTKCAQSGLRDRTPESNK